MKEEEKNRRPNERRKKVTTARQILVCPHGLLNINSFFYGLLNVRKIWMQLITISRSDLRWCSFWRGNRAARLVLSLFLSLLLVLLVLGHYITHGMALATRWNQKWNDKRQSDFYSTNYAVFDFKPAADKLEPQPSPSMMKKTEEIQLLISAMWFGVVSVILRMIFLRFVRFDSSGYFRLSTTFELVLWDWPIQSL